MVLIAQEEYLPMKKSILSMLCCLALLTLFPAVSRAEHLTEYRFKEITVRVPDRYMTLVRTGVLDEGAAGDDSFELTLDAFSADSTIYLDAADLDDGSEIIVRVVPLDEGFDFSYFNDMEADPLQDALEQYGTGNGIDMESARIHKNQQTTFFVYDGVILNAERNYTLVYCTISIIDDQFYGIYISGISENALTDQFRQDLEQIVETLKIKGYPDFEMEEASKPVDAYRSVFTTPEGLPFGLTIAEVEREEERMGNTNGDYYERDALSLYLTKNASYSTSLLFSDLTYLDIDQTRKSYHFDQNDLFYAVYYEFRIGYYLEIDGPDDIDNYAPAYQSVEEYLVKLYGDAQYSYSDGTKCEVDGYGMQSAFELMDGGLDEKRLYDYSEWLLDDPAGKIKIEHIMWFTGHIYKHNVTFELIRD
jgi:hypothetical protein